MDVFGKLRRLSRRGPAYGWYIVRHVLVARMRFRIVERVEPHRRSRKWLVRVGCLAAAALIGFTLGGWIGCGIGISTAALILAWIGSTDRRAMKRELRHPKAYSREGAEPKTLATGLDLEASRLSGVHDEPATLRETVVLGEIDNDGRVKSKGGDLPFLLPIREENFVPRYRYDLELVAREGEILIRKDYRGDGKALLREASCLSRLGESPAAPGLRSVNRTACTIEKTFVAGPTLRDILVEAGAEILSAHTEHDEQLIRLDQGSRLEAVWRRGQEAFDRALGLSTHDLPENLPVALEDALNSIHAQGVTGCSLTFGNVVFSQPGGQAVFIDFDGARLHRGPRGTAFDLARDRDRRLFNRVYGTSIETEESARKALADELATPYAPIDLGRGLVTRGFWSVDSGTGRWEYLNRDALHNLIRDKRILDLGTHNGVLSLMMLREGARSVTAIEQEPKMAMAAQRLHKILEWRDIRRYDFGVRCTDMRAVLDEDWGTFDLVTAFCSLYYLSEEEMHQVLRRAAEIAPTLVLQAKTDTRADAHDEKATKSSLDFLTRAATEEGWTVAAIHNKPGFSRPVLIAHRAA